MTTFELQPKYDSAKSFYKKANIRINDELHTSTLISYTTDVAVVHSGMTSAEDRLEVFGTYGATTLRHIKEFAKQYGFKAETKKQIEADYMGQEEEDEKRICNTCKQPMTEGYCIGGGEEYYCTKKCLRHAYTHAEIIEMEIGEEDSENYWTTWEE